ncbi:MAG: hypothetical protein G01um101429_666 [Parcubacteria group bacterium Gr01-1014_29]|nr:MAG: hypothetical protein G01um101429_666 [Parcubacteria group bacterium Gr01-1014_29]
MGNMMELFKYMRQLLFWNAIAGIAYADGHHAAGVFFRNRYRAVFFVVADSVCEQICEHFF